MFCGVAIALARMHDHVAVHLQKRVVMDPRMRREAEPCGFCGSEYKHVHHKYCAQENEHHLPVCSHIQAQRPCTNKNTCPVNVLFAGASATPWVLNCKTRLARCHRTVAPNTVDLTECVVASQDDEKKRGEPKNAMFMKPKITLKVAQVVDLQ